MAQFSFNAASAPVAPTISRGPLPEGQYEVIITRTDIKTTQRGDGEYIELEMQVTAGEHAGRRHWERLNVSNPNKKAEDIAKAALGQLCLAVGVHDMTDTEQLQDIPFVASIEVDRKDPTRNRIVGYHAASTPAPKTPAASARPAAPAGARPWAR